ncbi:MAG: VTT domain-containing protein [Myxococcota bacterium]
MPDFPLLLATYGPWIIALAVALDQLGIPIPSAPTLMLAGSMIASGELSGPVTLAAATLASLPPDLLWFELGRRRGQAVLGLLCRISLEPDSCVRTTRESFEKRGPGTLLFAKFVPGLQTVAPPLAGAGGMSVARFLVFDAVGALVFNLTFLAAGYGLKTQIEGFLALLAEFGTRLLTVIAVSIVGWVAWKFVQRQRFLRRLRIARIDVRTLGELLASDAPPVVYDLRDRLTLASQGGRVPGARMIRLDELEARHAEIPRDREIVVYCACPNEVTSASVALLLRKRGIERVRPLEGGFDAWREAGLPIEAIESEEGTEEGPGGPPANAPPDPLPARPTVGGASA